MDLFGIKFRNFCLIDTINFYYIEAIEASRRCPILNVLNAVEKCEKVNLINEEGREH